MDTLYGQGCPHCGGFTNAATEVKFSTEALTRMLRDIYNGMDVRGQVQRDAFEETLRLFNGATAEGLSQASWQDYDDLFLEQLRTGNEVFSAFRVHRMQNDMAARLLDDGGRLKPFGRWLEDIRDISSHYNASWLRTEYDTAILRAQQAAEWKRFQAETDIYPNLRWMPTTSPEPDAGHRQYWQARLTLPVGHPFWEQHRPGDRWNCKCSLEQTDEPATADSIAGFTPVPPVDGLDNNPADDGRLFSSSHPYFTQAHSGAKEATSNLLRKKLSEWAKENLPVVKVGKMEMKRFEVSTPGSDEITVINRNFYEEVASKYKDSPHYAMRLALARKAHELFPKSVFVRDEVPQHHKDASVFKVYEYNERDVLVEFKCKVNPDGSFLYFMRIL